MENFQAPEVIPANFVAVENFILISNGIFLWEFFTTIDFEWKYLNGEIKFKWPLLLYSICRICGLGVVICNVISGSITYQINCQQFTTWSVILAGTSFACASMLMTIRVIAIWSYNILIMAVTVGIYITNVGLFLYSIAMMRSKWSNVLSACTKPSNNPERYNLTAIAATDIAQLVIMSIGLLRTRRERRGLLRYLYIQGLMWLVVAMMTETPTAILANLNLNVPWNTIFPLFSVYSMIICATRMYRDLISYDMDLDLHKYSYGPSVKSTFRFGALPRKTMTTGIGTGTGTGGDSIPARFDPALVCTKDSEINLAEIIPVKDEEEAESHMPSLLVRDSQPK